MNFVMKQALGGKILLLFFFTLWQTCGMSQQMFVCGKAFPVKLEYLPGCCHSLICIDIAHMRKMQCEDLMQVRRGWGGNFGSGSGGIASLYSCQLDLYQTEMLGQGPTEWSLI